MNTLTTHTLHTLLAKFGVGAKPRARVPWLYALGYRTSVAASAPASATHWHWHWHWRRHRWLRLLPACSLRQRWGSPRSFNQKEMAGNQGWFTANDVPGKGTTPIHRQSQGEGGGIHKVVKKRKVFALIFLENASNHRKTRDFSYKCTSTAPARRAAPPVFPV